MKKRIGLFWIGILVLLFSGCSDTKTVYLNTEPSTEEAFAAEDAATEAVKESTEKSICYVYVCGAVCAPGVYPLPSGSRIYEAIMAAGGLREDAESDCINQAEIVSDGQMIKVLTVEEANEEAKGAQEAESKDNASGKVNINTANEQELMTLPGIGLSKAESIISYRSDNGRFGAIEDIMNITGIKEGVFTKIKDDITVD